MPKPRNKAKATPKITFQVQIVGDDSSGWKVALCACKGTSIIASITGRSVYDTQDHAKQHGWDLVGVMDSIMNGHPCHSAPEPSVAEIPVGLPN